MKIEQLRNWGLILVISLAQGCSHNHENNKEHEIVLSPPTMVEAQELLDSGNFAELDRRVSATQMAYEKGTITDEGLRAAFLVFYTSTPAVGIHYDAWVSAYPKSYVARVARGIYYKKVGQESRGDDSIANTSPEQLDGMKRAFNKASADLQVSMKMSTKPLLSYLHEMDIAMYEGNDSEIRELLDLSIKIDPGNFIVREEYMGTLEPRWGGSFEEMYAFLEESRKAGLSARQMSLLEAVIRADQAHTHLDAEEYADAERDYRAAIELGAEGYQSYLVSVLIVDHKDEEAIAVLSQILSKDPGDVRSRQMRAHAYRRLGKMHEAVDDFTVAAESGEPFSQNELGRFNLTGVPGVLQANPEVAVSWFRKSAAQGNLAGSMELEKALKLLGTKGASVQPN